MSDGRQPWTPKVNPWFIAVAVMSATFMEVLDTSVANVSLPHIAGAMDASTDEATWVLTSYLVSNAIVLPAASWLARRFGRARFLIICICIFTLASFVCGAATSLGMLIVARVIQGAGGGALQPLSQAILLESFPPARRGQAMAAFGLGIVVAPIIGPTLGGWLTDNLSWRWVFYINLPIGILAILMVRAFVEDPPYIKANRPSNIDYLGFSLMALWLATLQIVLDKGQEDDWFNSRFIVTLCIISLSAMISFIVWELRTKVPIVDLHVLKDRNFAAGTLLIGVVGAVLYSTNAILPLLLQNLMGYPALLSGLSVSPRGFGSIVAMIIISRLMIKIDARQLIACGFVGLAFATWLLSNVTLDITMWTVVWPNVLSGFALGFVFVPLTTQTNATLANEQIGNAAGIYNLMRNIGGSVGISWAATLLARGGQINQANLVHNMSIYNPAFVQRLQMMERYLHSQQAALGLLAGQLAQQAALLSFVNDFRLFAMLALGCTPLILLFRRAERQGGPMMAH
ncbi:MAG: DHA2 family efflux MFS transporter permease subunit [Candidatus Xenobia bacterium]